MKKLRVTVNGTTYDVEVEVVEDDDAGVTDYGYNRASMRSPQSAQAASASASIPRGRNNGTGRINTAKDNESKSNGVDVISSPLAGVVAKVKVSPGDEVKPNDIVVVIEAMKMFTNISAPTAGKVKATKVTPGDAVQQGQVLIELE